MRIADTPADPGPVLDALAAGDADALSDAFHNALLPAAESVDPRLADVRRAAESALGRRVCMTGSGSTLFVPLPADTDLEPAALTIPGIRRMVLTRSR